MLADVSAAVAGRGPRGAARRKAAALLNEVYPESEYNLQPAVASAGKILDCCIPCTNPGDRGPSQACFDTHPTSVDESG